MPRAPLIVGLLGVLGLLSYPLPTAWLGLLALVGLAGVRWRRLGRPCPASPFSLPLGLYLAGAAVGLYVAVRPEMAQVRFFGLLGAIGALFLVVDGIRSPRAAHRLVSTLLGVLLVACLLLLVLIAPQLRLDRLPGRLDWLPAAVDGLAAATQPLRTATVEVEGVGQRYRFSTAGLGILATYGLGLALGPLLAGPDRRTRLLGGLTAGAFVAFMILPANRTAILAAPLLPIALLAMRSGRVLTGLAIGLGLLAGLVALAVRVPSLPLGRLVALLPATATDAGPIAERVEFWRNYLFLLEDFRVTGVGLGLRSVSDVYQRRFLPIDPGYNHAHNMLLQSYLEQGLLGLGGMVGLIVVTLVVGALALRRAREPLTREAAIAGSGAALAFLLDGLTEIVPLTTVGMVLLFGAMGLTFVAYRLARSERAERAPVEQQPARPTLRRVASAVAILALLGAGALALLPTEARAGQAAGLSDERPVLLRPFLGAASQLMLNLGALELNKALIVENVPRAVRQRHFERADLFLGQAQQLDSNSLGAYRNRAQLAIARSQASDARRLLSEARARAAEDDSLFEFQVGRLYREAGSLEQAINAWARVDPLWGAWSCSNPYMQYLRWGVELIEATRYESAEKVARAAIKVAPIERQPYRLLSSALLAGSGEAAAIAAQEELVSADPTAFWPYWELYRLHARAGRDADAMSWRLRGDHVRAQPDWDDRLRRQAQPRNCRQYLPTFLSED